MDGNHVIIVKKIEEELNGLIKRTLEKQLTKKGLMSQTMQYLIFLLSKIHFKKIMCNEKTFARP